MATETEHVPFIRHVLVYGVGALATPLAGLIVVPLYTHYLEPSQYGSLQLIYRIGGIFHICLMIGGIRLAVFNVYGQSEAEPSRQHAAASITAFTGLVLIVGAILTIVFGRWLDTAISFGDATLLIWGVLALKARTLTVMPLALMQARFESVSFVIANLAIAACQVVFVALALVVGGWGVWGVLAAVAGVHGAFGVVLTARELLRTTWRPDRKQIKEIGRFAIPFVPAGLFFFVMHNGDHFLLMRHSGAAALGVYALGYQFVQVLETIAFMPLSQVWHPWMYRAYRRPSGRADLGKAATRLISIFVVLSVGLVVFREEVIGLLATAAYSHAAAVIPILALAYVFSTAANLADASFFVTQKTHFKPLVAGASAAVFVALYAVLIPSWGTAGAAWATLIGFGFHLLTSITVAQYVYRIDYEWGRLMILGASSTLVITLAELTDHGAISITLRVLLCILWPLGMLAVGFFDDTERWYLRRGLAILQSTAGRVFRREIASDSI